MSQCWNEIEMNLVMALNWCALKMAIEIELIQMKWFKNFVKFDVQMANWLTNFSWHCFKFTIEMENVEFKVSFTATI